MLTKRQSEFLASLAALLIALFFGSLICYNTIDIEKLQDDRKQLKQEIVRLRQLIEDRTHPGTIQKRQIEYLLHEGEFKE
ncbi:hypothetical protein EV210_101219 [Anaerospora hongkongensis]|uniref:Uncharacterized protein n=1 Tax=Anaerospora hongkongensis TaxID=244830 RepID=A0A4R1Q222_9FIRM|nr:hypothetical protein [Anaerospora hongkongensis]TCL40019.1 hypothetical protein EV210_101219 [Anaerospora hongkongensis]